MRQALLGLVVVLAACGGSGTYCTPGATQGCVCSNGRTGAQACLTSGAGFGACACDGTTPPVTTGCSPACIAGFRCTSANTCELDPTSQWSVTITSGSVATAGPGGSWDVGGGAPCPYVCLTLNGTRSCTPFANDTFAPVWNFPTPTVAASTLLGSVPSVFADDDVGEDDRICSDTAISFSLDQFVAGGGRFSCNYGSWNFTLHAR